MKCCEAFFNSCLFSFSNRTPFCGARLKLTFSRLWRFFHSQSNCIGNQSRCQMCTYVDARSQTCAVVHIESGRTLPHSKTQARRKVLATAATFWTAAA